MIGLDNSGKTTLINHLKPKKASVTEVVPTVGFQVETFTKDNINFTIFDMSGQGRYRSLWEQYYEEVEAIIFVVDCTDALRMCVAKDELEALLQHASVRRDSCPVLLFANKMDLPDALSPVECMQILELDSIREHPWHIASSNAVSGEGVDEGIAWLGDQMGRRQR